MIIKTEKIHTRNVEMKINDVKQHLKNYKLRKRCNLNRCPILVKNGLLTWSLRDLVNSPLFSNIGHLLGH